MELLVPNEKVDDDRAYRAAIMVKLKQQFAKRIKRRRNKLLIE